MFAWKHQDDPAPHYAEISHDGRIYVVGKQSSADAFEKTHHLPYTRTFIGAGPGGKTVVFEVDKKDDGLADWLVAEFERRHGSLK